MSQLGFVLPCRRVLWIPFTSEVRSFWLPSLLVYLQSSREVEKETQPWMGHSLPIKHPQVLQNDFLHGGVSITVNIITPNDTHKLNILATDLLLTHQRGFNSF